jgi:hypothetical protein
MRKTTHPPWRKIDHGWNSGMTKVARSCMQMVRVRPCDLAMASHVARSLVDQMEIGVSHYWSTIFMLDSVVYELWSKSHFRLMHCFLVGLQGEDRRIPTLPRVIWNEILFCWPTSATHGFPSKVISNEFPASNLALMDLLFWWSN